MYNRAYEFMKSHIYIAKDKDEMIDIFQEKNGFVKAMWCGKKECEEEIKSFTGGASSRCIPFDEEQISDKCVCCGKKAKHMVYWGKSY